MDELGSNVNRILETDDTREGIGEDANFIDVRLECGLDG